MSQNSIMHNTRQELDDNTRQELEQIVAIRDGLSNIREMLKHMSLYGNDKRNILSHIGCAFVELDWIIYETDPEQAAQVNKNKQRAERRWIERNIEREEEESEDDQEMVAVIDS